MFQYLVGRKLVEWADLSHQKSIGFGGRKPRVNTLSNLAFLMCKNGANCVSDRVGIRIVGSEI